MALLVLPHTELEPTLAALLHPDLRREVADNVNRAILDHQAHRREAAIRQLVKMRAWAENTARAEKKSLPDKIEIPLNTSEDRHDPMLIS